MNVIVWVAKLTTCVKIDDVAAAKLVSPLYSAVTEWDPPVSEDVLYDASPTARVLVPKVVTPSLKVIDPEGVPAELVTEPFIVIRVPYIDGFGVDDTDAVEAALFTVRTCWTGDAAL